VGSFVRTGEKQPFLTSASVRALGRDRFTGPKTVHEAEYALIETGAWFGYGVQQVRHPCVRSGFV
jgi:hypothetical protein